MTLSPEPPAGIDGRLEDFDALCLQLFRDHWSGRSPSVEVSALTAALIQLPGTDDKARRLHAHWLHSAEVVDLIILHAHVLHQCASSPALPLVPVGNSPETGSRLQVDRDRVPPGSCLPVTLIAENLRSAWNIGSLFRLADGIGVEELVLTGYTVTPGNGRGGADHRSIAASAMGAEKTVSWRWCPDTRLVLPGIKKRGIRCFGLETLAAGMDLLEQTPPLPIALFLGNERWGLSPTTLAHLDGFVRLPMFGIKNSLNVIQAASAALYLIRRQHQQSYVLPPAQSGNLPRS